MATHVLTRQFKDIAGVTHGGAESVAADGERNFDGVINTGVTDGEIKWGCTRANLRSFCILSTQDVTVETNNATTPQDTITLKAGKPLVWSLDNDGLARCPFSNNVTTLFVTNSSGNNANITLRALEDVTP